MQLLDQLQLEDENNYQIYYNPVDKSEAGENRAKYINQKISLIIHIMSQREEDTNLKNNNSVNTLIYNGSVALLGLTKDDAACQQKLFEMIQKISKGPKLEKVQPQTMEIKQPANVNTVQPVTVQLETMKPQVVQPASSNSNLTFKVKLDDRTEIVLFDEFSGLQKTIEEAFEIEIQSYELFFMDEEEDHLIED